MLHASVVEILARALTAGEMNAESAAQRIVLAVGLDKPWVHRIAARFVQQFEGRTRPRHRDVLDFLMRDDFYWRLSGD